jgi:hypothetical protein
MKTSYVPVSFPPRFIPAGQIIERGKHKNTWPRVGVYSISMISFFSIWNETSRVMMLNEQDWRPITFQGVAFPATLMAISMLANIVEITDEELNEWLWRLPICCGVTKSAPAKKCARCARQAVALLRNNRQRVIDGIRERLVPDGFEPERTYVDWIDALQQIAVISESTAGDCKWSAPSHRDDPIQSAADLERLRSNLERAIDRAKK